MEFRIRFRAFKMEDAKFVNDLRKNEVMEKLVGGTKRPVAFERDQKWIEDIILKDNNQIIYFAITLVDSEEIIGYTSISDIDYRNGSCFWSGIKVDPNQSGKGIGTEIALKVLQYVFEEMRMERCKGECLEEHNAVLQMLLKIGFRQEGLMRHSLYKNATFNNQWLLSVIKDDYKIIKEKFDL